MLKRYKNYENLLCSSAGRCRDLMCRGTSTEEIKSTSNIQTIKNTAMLICTDVPKAQNPKVESD